MKVYIIVKTCYGKIENYLGLDCNLHNVWFQEIEYAKLFSSKESALKNVSKIVF